VERLNRQLRKIGIVAEKLPVKTRPNGGPPCYRMCDTPYKDWLSQASVAFETLPYRLDMPAEPNYCHDCTAGFKARMVERKACIFPDTKFEEIKEFGEATVVGVSHSPEVAPEDYPVYSDITANRRTK
jgi:hypothetical protein